MDAGGTFGGGNPKNKRLFEPGEKSFYPGSAHTKAGGSISEERDGPAALAAKLPPMGAVPYDAGGQGAQDVSDV